MAAEGVSKRIKVHCFDTRSLDVSKPINTFDTGFDTARVSPFGAKPVSKKCIKHVSNMYQKRRETVERVKVVRAGNLVRAGRREGGLRPPFLLRASVVARPHGGAVSWNVERVIWCERGDDRGA